MPENTYACNWSCTLASVPFPSMSCFPCWILACHSSELELRPASAKHHAHRFVTALCQRPLNLLYQMYQHLMLPHWRTPHAALYNRAELDMKQINMIFAFLWSFTALILHWQWVIEQVQGISIQHHSWFQEQKILILSFWPVNSFVLSSSFTYWQSIT